jgi:triacylglycerol lipase
VLLVHGIFGHGTDMDPLRDFLVKRCAARTREVDLTPNDGTVGVEVLAQQVDAAVEQLRKETGAARVDVVGHSMGALVLRYWLQRLGGRDKARRYVSLAGPHRGVVAGLVTQRAAGQEMKLGSPFLADLARDPDPFGAVQTFDFYTPYDAVIVPALRQELPHATLRLAFPVHRHHEMVTDPTVLEAVARALLDGRPEAPAIPALRVLGR